MSVLTTLPPALAPDVIAVIVRNLYGLAGTLTPLDSERDQNFRVTEDDGTSWVLKIANQAEDSAALAFQAALLRHVQAVDPDLPLPHLRPTLGGDDLGKGGSRGGPEHLVRLVSWLPGQLYSGCRKTADLHDSLGESLGRLDRALCRASAIPGRTGCSTGTSSRPADRARGSTSSTTAGSARSSTISWGVSRPRSRRGWRGCAHRSSMAMPTTTTCWWTGRLGGGSPD